MGWLDDLPESRRNSVIVGALVIVVLAVLWAVWYYYA